MGGRNVGYPRNTVTAREQEVMELATQGLTNKEIAQELRIKSGTVKIHMKHIFEKTGIRGRHSLALENYRDSLEIRTGAHFVARA